MYIPQDFERRMAQVFGDEGRAWAARLPALLREVAGDWDLELLGPVPNLSYHYVAFARCQGEEVVLKLGVPRDDLNLEIDALHAFHGQGAVRLIRSDHTRGAMLLERLQPGTMLHQQGTDEEQTRTAAGVMKRLWTKPPSGHRFPTIQHWMRAFDDPRSAPIQDLINRVRPYAEELVATTEQSMLLHGDLHHENILLGKTGWQAIDPQGVIADPGFEVGCYLRNKLDHDNLEVQLRTRIEIFSGELSIPESRLAQWGYVNMALSMAWGFEEEEGTLCETTMGVARELERVYQL